MIGLAFGSGSWLTGSEYGQHCFPQFNGATIENFSQSEAAGWGFGLPFGYGCLRGFGGCGHRPGTTSPVKCFVCKAFGKTWKAVD